MVTNYSPTIAMGPGGPALQNSNPQPITPPAPVPNPKPTLAGPYNMPEAVVPKSTSVISPKPAINQINNEIKPTLDASKSPDTSPNNVYGHQFTDAGGRLVTEKFNYQTGQPLNPNGSTTPVTPPPPPPPVTPPPPKTIEDHQADLVMHPGQVQLYNQRTGQQEWVAPGTSGYGDQNPLTRTDATVVHGAGGIDFKQFSDGTYGRFDLNTGSYLQSNATEYNNAKSVNDAQTTLDNLKNGILTSVQQTQIDAIKQQFKDLIDKQTVVNSNTTGANTIAQNLYGMGNTISGQGEITQVINDGAKKIATLQSQMAEAISKMTSAFQSDDMDALKNAYNIYSDAQKDIQHEIDNMTAKSDTVQSRIDAANTAFATTMAEKFSDTTDPILTTDTRQQVLDKLRTSPLYQQGQQLTASLDSDAQDFWAQMAISGAGKDVAVVSMGMGKLGNNEKIKILQTISDNAKKVGLTAPEIAASLTSKTAMAKANTKMESQKDLLQAGEDKVSQDFNLLKKIGKTLNQQELLTTGSSWLDKYIKFGAQQATASTPMNQALTNYMGLLTTTLTAYARVIAGQTGAAGVGVAANDEAQKLLNIGLGTETINNYIDNVAVPEMNNTITGYEAAQKSLMGSLSVASGNQSTMPNDVGGGGTNNNTNTNTGSSDLTSGWTGFQ